MKKQHKLISLTTAILLAAVPLVTTVAPITSVLATTNAQLSFVYNNKNLTNNSILPLTQGISVQDDESLDQILAKAKKEVSLTSSSARITTNVSEVMGQLQSQNILIRLVQGKYVIDKVPATGFYITLTAREGNQAVKVKVPFGNAYTVTEGASEVYVSYTQENEKEEVNVDNLVFQISVGSKFDPLNFVGSNGSQFKLLATNNGKLVVDSNTVDPTNAGSVGEVKVTANNSTGQKTTATFLVLVQPNGMQRLGIASWTDSYRILDQRAWQSEQLNRGDIVYVGNDTQIIGNTSYTRISTKSQADANDSDNNMWIKTIDLAHQNVDSVTKKIMHTALVYDNIGGSKYRKIAAFKSVTFEKKLYVIKGVKYYKVINAPDYIKATNIDGTKRKLKHNAYIYSTSTRRTTHKGAWKLYKGSTVTTYGGSYKFKNGKRYYRIGGPAKQYVRTSNFN
ncbi:SLAP domain-containing protein [Lactobacillus crispatus]|uniref:SLAP domain-containing protein n=1 Tax=Lactobacillus crispatus TaxID=47770 RepID=UPI0018A99B98|nr:SLAP domain-containing protein [Lactobacillus crispatus]